MARSTPAQSIPPCGCGRNCRCRSQVRCRCHNLNALLALTLWDYGRMLRRKTLP